MGLCGAVDINAVNSSVLITPALMPDMTDGANIAGGVRDLAHSGGNGVSTPVMAPAHFTGQVLSMAETNCAKWRRESVPVGLRQKDLEASVYFHASVPIYFVVVRSPSFCVLVFWLCPSLCLLADGEPVAFAVISKMWT